MKPNTDEIREILARRIDERRQSVGMAAGIVDADGRRVAAYGSFAKGDPRAVDGDTIFEIGSVTKVFTSLLLADMVERNEVALDDPAAKYLPGTVKMPERSGKRITLLDLVTHRSGLPPLLIPGDHGVEDLYRSLSGYELPRDPGSEYEYSNAGAGLLGHLLAERAGTDYESLIQARITRPLGMADTGIALSAPQKRRMATGHNALLAPVAHSNIPTPLLGAGALRSSANDMLTFVEALLGYRDSPLGPAMKAMSGIRIHSIDGREIAGHGGRTEGFCASLGYDAKERAGVVVFSNAAIDVDDIGLQLLGRKISARAEISIDGALLDGYVGRYQVTPNLIFEITRDGERLFAQGLAGEMVLPKFELFAEGEKKFFAKVADHQITFETGSEGQATSLVLRRGGRDLTAPRLQ
jgi:CubicO group peptidase (beta-lactamase class C family)